MCIFFHIFTLKNSFFIIRDIRVEGLLYYGNASSCGQNKGRFGPTLSMCRSSYAPSWTDNDEYLQVDNGIQIWTVPTTGLYTG